MKTSTENPQMKAVLDQLAALCGKISSTVTAIEARKKPTPADAVKSLLQKQGRRFVPQSVGSVTGHSIDGPGGKISIRIYAPPGEGPFPVVVYYHGGGWVIADLDTCDASPRALVNAAHAVVVSAHYRQAPEHKFPAAHEDALAAYQWALTHARAFKGDPSKIAVMGESAGGNMAAAVCLMARDKGLPLPVHQILVYPVANYGFDTPSYDKQANARPLNKGMMKWFFGHYLSSPESGNSPLVSLLRAHPLKGLPPATIITAELDPLRSEGEMFADKLQQAGVPVTYRNYDGMAHEFFGMGAVVDQANDAVRFAADGLRSGCNQRAGRISEEQSTVKRRACAIPSHLQRSQTPIGRNYKNTQRVTSMNKLKLDGDWNMVKGKIKQKWAKLTDDDIRFIEGKEDELIGRIQKRTGETQAVVERAIHNMVTD